MGFIVRRYFFFNGDLKCLRIEIGCIHPPPLLWLLKLTLPPVRWYPHIFPIKMIKKKKGWITEKNRKGVATTPLVRWGLILAHIIFEMIFKRSLQEMVKLQVITKVELDNNQDAVNLLVSNVYITGLYYTSPITRTRFFNPKLQCSTKIINMWVHWLLPPHLRWLKGKQSMDYCSSHFMLSIICVVKSVLKKMWSNLWD